MGRKRNPFLTKRYCPKTYPYVRGRIYEYDYIYAEEPWNEYCVYLEWNEIRELNKEDDVEKLSLEIRKLWDGDCDHDIPVKFTPEEFKNFRRTKIMEHNSTD